MTSNKLERRLPDWFDAYMKFVEDTEPPRIYEKWGALSAIASVVERKVWLIWDNRTYINMYIVLVGPAGCRKTITLDHAFDFVSAVDGLVLAPNSSSPRRLLSVMEEAHRDVPLANNAGMIGQSAITVWSEEFSVFLKFDNRDMIELLTDFYDCKDNRPWKHETEHSGKNEIKDLWLNLLACTTPESLQETLITKAIGKGLGSRVMFVYADKVYKYIQLPFMRFLSEEEQSLKNDLVNDIQYIGTLLSGQFGYDEDFLKYYCSWYPSRAIESPPDYLRHPNFAGYLNRRAKHLLKTSMAFSISRSDELVLRGKDFIRALTLMEETEKVMSNVFGGVGTSTLAPVIYKAGQLIAQVKVISFDDLCAKFMYDCTPDQMSRQVIPSLKAAGVVKKTPRIEGGKVIIEFDEGR